uniref:Uncharacterized protein n=1 Tax=Rhizophora mucronata TaxID=61149 RepID=A0A2P2PIG1_RHIMU
MCYPKLQMKSTTWASPSSPPLVFKELGQGESGGSNPLPMLALASNSRRLPRWLTIPYLSPIPTKY